MRNPGAPPSFAALVQSFFAEHLTQQRALSARTVAAYRDAFMLFLEFAQARLHKPPTAMLPTDITPALILAFLDHLDLCITATSSHTIDREVDTPMTDLKVQPP